MNREKKRVQSLLEAGADYAAILPIRAAPKIAQTMDRVASNQIAPLVIVVVVVAVAAFLALALVIGALAAYIWYCQSRGGQWPGFSVPTPKNGYYSLRCVK